jgi:PAS domain S-box-containing protein
VQPRRFHWLAVAILWAVVALLLRIALLPVLGRRGPYLFFLLATLGSAAMGGFRSGIVTTISSILLAGFFLAPGGIAHLIDPDDPTSVVRFGASALVVSCICQLLISARDRARTAELRLRESERIYRAIGESIPFGIWICDAKGRNQYTSESLLKLTGTTQQEFSDVGWVGALHAEDQQRIAAQWRDCVTKEGIWDVEMRYRGLDGSYHPVLMRGVPVRDDNGHVVCWAGINLDISRLKQTEAELNRQAEELRRSNRDLEQFAFVASHDLQEPLRTVNIYAELLLRNVETSRSPELDQFAAFVREGVLRMESLIHDLLAYSRVLQNDVEQKPVDAGLVARQALMLCQTSIEESGADIDLSPLPEVLAGEPPLLQVFQNLISNALKYRKPETPPRVRITGEVQGPQVLFKIKDNGIGFDPLYADKIFNLFTRLHGRKYPGTGLGLAICQRIVERYGGQIWAESKPDEGSTFCFTLPSAPGISRDQGVSAAISNQ